MSISFKFQQMFDCVLDCMVLFQSRTTAKTAVIVIGARINVCFGLVLMVVILSVGGHRHLVCLHPITIKVYTQFWQCGDLAQLFIEMSSLRLLLLRSGSQNCHHERLGWEFSYESAVDGGGNHPSNFVGAVRPKRNHSIQMPPFNDLDQHSVAAFSVKSSHAIYGCRTPTVCLELTRTTAQGHVSILLPCNERVRHTLALSQWRNRKSNKIQRKNEHTLNPDAVTEH